MLILGYVAIICMGIVLGSVGAGGSMLAIPVLVYVFTIDVEAASACSLFLVGITSLLGAVLKRREQLVSVQAAFLFGIPSMTAAFICRKWIITSIPELIWESGSAQLTKDHALLTLLALLMVASSVMILLKKAPRTPTPRTPHAPRLMILGFLVGLVSALAGTGGGFLILPALTVLAGLPFPTATGTSLLIIASNCLIAFCGDVLNHAIDWYFLLSLTALAVSGLLAGYGWQKKTQHWLSWQHVFAWFTMLMGATILVKEAVL